MSDKQYTELTEEQTGKLRAALDLINQVSQEIQWVGAPWDTNGLTTIELKLADILSV